MHWNKYIYIYTSLNVIKVIVAVREGFLNKDFGKKERYKIIYAKKFYDIQKSFSRVLVNSKMEKGISFYDYCLSERGIRRIEWDRNIFK